MDPITHLMTGALIGQALSPKDKKAWVLGAAIVGAELPDIDVFFHPGDPLAWLESHRGFTHSLLGLPVMALLPAWLLSRLKRAPGFKILALALGLGVASHIILDMATSWGTMVMHPSLERYSWDLLFIVDLWFSGILALGLGLSFYLKKARVWGLATLALGLAYGALAGAARNQASHEMRRGVLETGLNPKETRVFPQALNPFLFSCYAMEEGRVLFLRGGWGPGQADPAVFPRLWNGEIRALLAQDPLGRAWLRFARVPMAKIRHAEDGEMEVSVVDLRFSTAFIGRGNPENPFDGTLPFRAVFKVRDGRVVEGRMAAGSEG